MVKLKTLLKTGLTLSKIVLLPLTKSALIPLILIVAISAADTGIRRNVLISRTQNFASYDPRINCSRIFASGTTTLTISNENMDDIKIFKSLENSGVLRKRITKTVENEGKSKEGVFLDILLCTLGESFLGNL